MKQNQILKFLILSSFVVALLGIANNEAMAKEEAKEIPATNNCDLTIELGKLSEIKGGDLVLSEKEREELAVRKQILTKTLTCSSEESISLIASLNKLKDLNETEAKIKDQLIADLESFKEYYSTESSKTTDEINLEETKNIAKEISAWREENYNPKTQTAHNFLLLINEKEMLAVADGRYQKISLALKMTGLSNHPKIKKTFISSKDELTQARYFYNEAYKAFINETLNTKASEDKTPVLLEEKNTKEKVAVATSQEQLKKSLDKLKNTYQKFSDIGEAIKKILG